MKLNAIVSAHKIIGMVATIFIVLLSVTGILLMHTEDLDLAESYIESESVLAIYDIAPDTDPVTYQVNKNYITQLDDRIYFNELQSARHEDKLIGGIYIEGIYLAGFTSSIMLLTDEGEVIETLDQLHGVPAKISAIGKSNNSIIVNADGFMKRTDINMTTWTDTLQTGVSWSEQAQLSDDALDSILKSYIGEGLPLERVILDVHSGRILGTVGVIIVDLAVVLFLVLSISGWMAWYKKRELQKLIDEEEN